MFYTLYLLSQECVLGIIDLFLSNNEILLLSFKCLVFVKQWETLISDLSKCYIIMNFSFKFNRSKKQCAQSRGKTGLDS